MRGRRARKHRQFHELPEARDNAISLVISELDLVLSVLDLRKEKVDAEAAAAEAESCGEAAAVGVGGEGGNDSLPPPPYMAGAVETPPIELEIEDGRVVELALQPPRAPNSLRGEDSAPRATANSCTKARQLPTWMYERMGEGVK